jgi:hypothetical protein
LRETPESFFYYLLWETITIPKGNDRGHSKNEKDWTIRSQASKCVMQAYEEGSETYNEMEMRRLAIFGDSLRYSPFS